MKIKTIYTEEDCHGCLHVRDSNTCNVRRFNPKGYLCNCFKTKENKMSETTEIGGKNIIGLLEVIESGPKKEQDWQKDDEGKIRWDLLPWDAIKEVVKVQTFAVTPKDKGGRGYTENSWVNVPQYKYKAALQRHFVDWTLGEIYDTGKNSSGLHHLAHAATNALFLLSQELKRIKSEAQPF